MGKSKDSAIEYLASFIRTFATTLAYMM